MIFFFTIIEFMCVVVLLTPVHFFLPCLTDCKFLMGMADFLKWLHYFSTPTIGIILFKNLGLDM